MRAQGPKQSQKPPWLQLSSGCSKFGKVLLATSSSSHLKLQQRVQQPSRAANASSSCTSLAQIRGKLWHWPTTGQTTLRWRSMFPAHAVGEWSPFGHSPGTPLLFV